MILQNRQASSPCGKPYHVPGSEIRLTATYTFEMLYQVGKSTIPLTGRLKILWKARTASAVAGPKIPSAVMVGMAG